MSQNITGTFTSGVTLSGNPANISGAGKVANTANNNFAVFGPAGTTWTLTNNGLVSETASGGIGIGFAQTGTITNASGGTITANTVGILLARGGVVTNASGGVVTGHGGIYGDAGTLAVVNAGTIGGYDGYQGGAGLRFRGGGSVTNQSGGVITGYQGFAAFAIAATVINAGTIGGNSLHGEGIYLTAGGAVTNLSTGLITGNYAVALQGGLGTLVNAGTITGYTGNAYVHSAAGFYGNGGGLVTNQSGGVITGFFGVSERAAALTVQNAGSIGGNATVSAASGVYLGAGGSVTNQAGGTISGYDGVLAVNTAATVVNAGVIAGNYTSNYQHADGVYLGAGGSVTNLATGNIYGRNDGVQITGGRGTVLNLGSIHSRVNATYGGPGISLDQGGIVTNGTAGGSASTAFIAGYNYAIKFGAIGTDTVVNYGTISGNPGTVAVTMATGTVINGPSGATGAQIISGLQSNAVLIGGPGTVVNYGTIGGAAANGEGHISYGVSIGGDGTVVSRITNTGALARINGYVAVYATQNATVTNAGTMEATQQFGGAPPIYAVIFGGGTNRLIVDPGAVFIGNVVGSGPVTLAPGGNTIITGTANGVGTTALELASGTSSGTLSGLGSKYTGFSAITIDTSAK